MDVSMDDMPDMVPTLASIAPFAEGKTVIRNVGHLRFKESDRLHSIATEWRRIGVRIEERQDGLVIFPGNVLEGCTVDPHDDHRIAMSLAVIACRVPGMHILDKGCVAKSFPAFWSLWERIQE